MISVHGFKPVEGLFAWSKSDACPIILGQQNFFQLFDVTFHGSNQTFQISLAISV